MSDLVQRLRNYTSSAVRPAPVPICIEAAEEIERLQMLLEDHETLWADQDYCIQKIDDHCQPEDLKRCGVSEWRIKAIRNSIDGYNSRISQYVELANKRKAVGDE